MAVSVAVCEIFSLKEWCDLENRVRVRWRSLKMAPFDRSHTSSYSPTTVTMAIACIVCEIQQLIGRKLLNCYTPPVFITLAGDPVRISWRCLMLIKTEWFGYRTVNKLWQYVKPFSSDTGTSSTDGKTDRQTDRQTELLYQYRASVCWRAIKIIQNKQCGRQVRPTRSVTTCPRPSVTVTFDRLTLNSCASRI